jgi:hypothetical protein
MLKKYVKNLKIKSSKISMELTHKTISLVSGLRKVNASQVYILRNLMDYTAGQEPGRRYSDCCNVSQAFLFYRLQTKNFIRAITLTF